MKVETYEQACALLKEPVLDLTSLPLSMQAAVKLRTIIKAMNDGRPMRYSDSDQDKYSAWWNLENVSIHHICLRYSVVPPFLHFYDEDEAQWSAGQHKDLWQALFNPKEI